MIESLVLTFLGHVPAKKNNRRMMKHSNVMLPSKAYTRWHEAEIATLHDAPAIPSPVAISYEFWIGGKDCPREFDCSNSEESINDLLVDTGIITDDSWLHLVQRQSRVAGFVRGEGRCVVTVSHVPDIEWREPVMLLKNAVEIRRLSELTNQPMTKIRQIEWEKITS